jgi:transposase InsO family protein
MELRKKFVDALAGGRFTLCELADEFGISRKTADKWWGRFREGGYAALVDRSRARLTQQHRMSAAVESALLAVKEKHVTWGPKKVRAACQARYPEMTWPAVSSVGDLFKRKDLVVPRRRRPRVLVSVHRYPEPQVPNDEWAVDFKGQWRLGDGSDCYPLTVSDGVSRALLQCRSLPSVAMEPTKEAFVATFREHGLPRALRMDNGVPFASSSHCLGLTRLSVWWVKLEIAIHRIDKGKPTQNGRHERMHRTLKAETVRPIQANHAAQQQRFDGFRREFNYDRPHEALGMRRPMDVHQTSQRSFPEALPQVEYPSHFERRMVNRLGMFKWRGRVLYVSEALIGEPIGLEVAEGGWRLYFVDHLIGFLDDENFELAFIH